MPSQPFSEILDECLDRLRAGASIDDCVARYPDHADELRAQLQSAHSLLASRPQIQPEPSAQALGRARLLGAVAQMREEPEPTLGLVGPLRALLLGIGSRLSLLPRALPAVLAMLILGGAAWGVSAATGNPNPGDWFAASSSQEERVELRGTIAALEPDTLTIRTAAGDISVQIVDATEFEDENKAPLALADFRIGDFVKISAFREDSVLIAREVELEQEDGADQQEDVDVDADGEDADDHSGPGSPNSGPGNADDTDDDEGQDADENEADNSGPGNGDDAEDEDDNSGPSENSGPGNADDDDEVDEKDNSGPGSHDDEEEDEPKDEEDD